MANSMTGFGSHTLDVDGLCVRVELRSVNHRFLDLQVRTPRGFAALQEPMSRAVAASLRRGHVDVELQLLSATGTTPGATGALVVDWDLVRSYLEAVQQAETLAKTVGVALVATMRTSELLALPGVSSLIERESDPESVWPAVEQALGAALGELQSMRAREGARLTADLLDHLAGIQRVVDALADVRGRVVDEYRARLHKRIAELVDESDLERGRLETEIAIFADRAAIDEELVRLRSHIAAARETLAAAATGEAVGRRLDFIVQEMHRELNTIGSKGNDAEIGRLIVDAKSTLEKMREQVQNVE